MGIVADHLRIEFVFSDWDFLEKHVADLVREGEVCDSGVSVGDEIDGCPAYRFFCLCVLESELDIGVAVVVDHVEGDDLRSCAEGRHNQTEGQ